MTSREEFEKETGIDISEWIQPDNVYCIDNEYIKKLYQYIEWLEKRSEADKEKVLSAIQDGLYATKNLTTIQRGIISEGIYQYLYEHGFAIIATPPDEAKRGRV